MAVSPPRRARRFLSLTTATVALAALMMPATAPSQTAQAPAVALASSTAPYCGAAVPKSTGGHWTCTFVDNFSGKVLDTTKWSAMTSQASGTGYPECRLDNPGNISVLNGALRLTVRKESRAFWCPNKGGNFVTQYTGGAVTTWGKFAQAYGRFEVRAKFPAATVRGLHSAIWLWPQEMAYGDASGELDIAEFRTNWADRVVPFIHYKQAAFDGAITNNYCYVKRPDLYHLYQLEWTPTSITFKYDGRICLQNTNWQPASPLVRPQPFNRRFVINLNQSLGAGANSYYAGVTPLPATMLVDYVKAWR